MKKHCKFRMNKLFKTSILLTVFSLVPISLWAQAPVNDAIPAGSTGTYSSSNEDPSVPLSQDNNSEYQSSSSASFNPNNPASLLSKINEMQTEIQRLRGQMEVQSHEIKKLQEQQKAYYNDLDQRISSLSSPNKSNSPILSLDTTTDVTTAPPSNSNNKETSVATKVSNSATTADEESSYNAAYAQIENKKFTQATDSMKTFIQKYPNGKYAANAHYWLGELLLAQHQDQEAMKEFQIVINQYPSSSKVSASMLKLGFAYANLGDIAKAKAQLMNVEQMFPGTATAQLAHQRLQTLN